MDAPQKTPSVRAVALDALVAATTQREFADELLAKALTESSLQGANRALAADIFWGTLRWRGRLDGMIAPIFHGDYRRANLTLKFLLRIGAYQLFLLDRVPDHAAVSQTVEIAIERLGKSAGGLVNAILRRLARERERWETPPEGADELARLAFQTSHPHWIVRQLVRQLGKDEAKQALEANNERPPLTLRANPLKISPEELEKDLLERRLRFERSRLVDGCFRLETPVFHSVQDLVNDGKVIIQDESAALVTLILDPQPGESILDLCAAPGGKTAHIFNRTEGKARIVAVEPDPVRAERLKENLARLGMEGVEVRVQDGREPIGETFDRVLVDAPCSSLGLLRRNPDIRWHRRPEHLEAQRALQVQLISAGTRCVKPGGLLVYSTCSILPRENNRLVEYFLRRYEDFERESVAPFVPAEVVDENGDMHTWTHRHGTDGAYASRLKRHSEATTA
ncbi:MAG: 16S rRNA (cytosine(967)-C(5))-methyltransferase RsmB [Calditrichaeota bacterium]|nr:16S rRNA (cytosine(967)-C(5))-methyltransferase RsmB [Calditrichota bacterium]